MKALSMIGGSKRDLSQGNNLTLNKTKGSLLQNQAKPGLQRQSTIKSKEINALLNKNHKRRDSREESKDENSKGFHSEREMKKRSDSRASSNSKILSEPHDI